MARGVVIVSGLATGIDAVAHKSAIECGGQTIAILPNGFNNIYPSSHTGLVNNTINCGSALVGEYKPYDKIAFKSNFIARNRIVAGLADVLLIPEAAKKSGSLHTANFAFDIGRDIFAVPGPINRPTSEGCNNLIKSGAYLATSADYILDKLGIKPADHTKNIPILEDKNQTLVLSSLHEGPLSIDNIQLLTGLDSSKLNQALSMLEIYGQIKPMGNSIWAIQ